MAEDKILIVDDETYTREFFNELLAEKGYSVALAKNGQEALEEAKRGAPNLALVDIKMADMDGIEVLNKLKQLDQDVMVIMITGYASVETAVQAIEGGAYNYLTKPFDEPDRVMKTIKEALEKQRLIIENRRLFEETVRQQKALKERVFELGVLYDVSSAISYTLNHSDLLQLIMSSLSKVIDYDLCISLLLTQDGRGGDLTVKTGYPVSKDFFEKAKSNVINAMGVLMEGGIEEKRVAIHVAGDKNDLENEKGARDLVSFFNVPLISKDKPIGIFNVSSGKKDAFSPANIRLIYTLAGQTSSSIDRIQAIIAAEKNVMNAMVESMSDGLIMTDEKSEVMVINPAARRMLGFKAEDEITTQTLINSFEDPKVKRLLKRGLGFAEEEEEEEEEEEIHITKPEPRTLSAAQAPVMGEGAKKLGFVTVLRDITKEKEVDRMKTEFISTVSHELRTPLTSMKNVVSNALHGVTGAISDKLKRYLLMMNEDIDRLSRLINNLLDISRIEAGKTELKKSPVDIDALARSAISSLVPQANKKNIELKITSPSDLGDLYVDPDKISQVFTNLIGNAIKFTPEGGAVAVTIDDRDQEVLCSVSDTGIGIPKDELNKVFGKFHQLSRVDGPGAKGTGLGLSITRELVKMHNGRIWAESPSAHPCHADRRAAGGPARNGYAHSVAGGSGKGSTFFFALPKTDTETVFREYLNNGLAQAKEEGTSLSLMVLTLANFDELKNKYKAKGISRILKEIEGIITKTVSRPVNIAPRHHKGEIPIVILKTGREEILSLEKKLKRAIKAHEFTLDGKPLKIEANFGMASYPEDGEAGHQLVKKLETSLKERRTYQPSIMVIDDEEDFAMVLKARLESANYRVVVCHNGPDALVKLKKDSLPDLIILDLMMPNINGHEMYMLLKENQKTARTPILILSAKGERADQRLGMEFAPYNYMTKPFESQQLLAKIKEMLEG